ncbi:MAG: hypothetical protein R3F46_05130 [bacterium]
MKILRQTPATPSLARWHFSSGRFFRLTKSSISIDHGLMPHTHCSAAELTMRGVVINVSFGIPGSLLQYHDPADQDAATTLKAVALVDTGASHSIIRGGLLDPLCLTAIGKARVAGFAAPVDCAIFNLLLCIPQDATHYSRQISVLEMEDWQDSRIDCILGRDILASAVLVYNGAADSFSLSF